MSEKTVTAEHFYTKDFNTYGQTENNFVASQEITVTITLNEYRNLISKNATASAEIEKVRSESYKKDREIERLNAENLSLKEKYYNIIEGPQAEE